MYVSVQDPDHSTIISKKFTVIVHFTCTFIDKFISRFNSFINLISVLISGTATYRRNKRFRNIKREKDFAF